MKMFRTIIQSLLLISALATICCSGSNYLKPGSNVDSENPLIHTRVTSLLKEAGTDAKKARILFEFVRDSIDERFNEDFKASRILSSGYGYCYNKAILLTAMARAAGIPARISFDRVYISGFKDERTGVIRDIRFLHGIAELFLNNRWIKYDVTGNLKRWRIWMQNDIPITELPLGFSAEKDVVFPSGGRIKFERTDMNFFDWDKQTDALAADFNRY
ncbi:MAG: transglutaminase-like domain-containing protein [Ignavibacteriales bacterium]